MAKEKHKIVAVNDWEKLREVMVGYPDETVEPDYASDRGKFHVAFDSFVANMITSPFLIFAWK